MTKAKLKARSEALQIPFSRLLAGFVLEKVLSLLAESEFGGNLWLLNGSSLGVEQYRRQNVLALEFTYVTDEKAKKSGALVNGQTLSPKLAFLMLACIVQKEKTPEIKWMGNLSTVQNNGRNDICLSIVAEFEEMKVPVRVFIRENEDFAVQKMSPAKKTLSSCVEDGVEISYLQYPTEELLAQKLFAVIRDMELLSDMEMYAEIYEILSHEMIDGRWVRELLGEACKKQNMDAAMKRVEEILSYRDYPYMKKRWQRYLRQQKKKTPSFEDVMELLAKFLPPIWEAVCRDEVFIGDWMPELLRFLG